MARSCGIRVGPRRYELVVLDGSPKRHKIVAYRAGEFPPGADTGERIATLKEAAKSHHIPHEGVGLVIDTGKAAFRRVALPFKDRAKIDQVLKYEVEGDLPQWNIDEVVVDYLVLTENASGCEVLATAVPKADLAEILVQCEKAGIEPLEAELETTAIVNAAAASDICHIDDAQLLVHVGDYSTSVVVMDGGEVRDMRVIHIGALTHEEVPVAKEDDGEAAEADGEEEAVVSAEPDPLEVARRVDQAVKRIRRELGRTVSASRTINPIEAIYVCGIEVPGLIGSQVLDVPVYLLDCFDEDSGQPADGFGALVAPYGAALRALGGGVLRPSLRREELRFTGAFERIEFPLAVACLLLCTFLGVFNIFEYRLSRNAEQGLRFWVDSNVNYMVGEAEMNRPGSLRPIPDDLKPYLEIFRRGGDPGEPALESLQEMRTRIQEKVLALQRELGQSSDVTQPQSAFVASNLVLGVLEEHQEQWRPSLRKVDAQYQEGRGTRTDSVKVTLDVTFFASNVLTATQNYEEFQRALEEHDWFVEFEGKRSEPLENGRGIFVQGAPITVDVSKFYQSLTTSS